MKKIIAIVAVIFFFVGISKAQNVGINATGAAPDNSSMLDVSSTNSGMLIPRMTQAQRNGIGGPATGLIIYQTNANPGFYYWDGAQWVRLFGGDAWELDGNAGTNPTNNFVGTTDNQPLRIRTNNVNRFEFATNGRLRSFNGGSAGAPTYSWTADTDIGMYRIGANVLGFSTAGVERMRIAANGNVGIRTNPATHFHVSDGGLNVGAAAMGDFVNGGADGVALSGYNTQTNNGFNAVEGVTEYNGAGAVAAVLGLHIYQGGLNSPGIGVFGVTNEWQGAGVRGQRFNSGGINNGWGGIFLNDLGYTGGFFNASDRRLKKDINPINDALSIVLNLNAVEYFYDTETYPYMGLKDKQDFGFIAQEIQVELPTIVESKSLPVNALEKPMSKSSNQQSEEKHENFLVVDYTRLIPILTKAIQEQQEQIKSLEQRIERLEKLIEEK